MEIGKNYKIESDSLNVTIYKRYKKKVGYDWKAVGFYSTVANALRGLVDFEVAGTGLKDFKTVVEKQERLYDLIKEAR